MKCRIRAISSVLIISILLGFEASVAFDFPLTNTIDEVELNPFLEDIIKELQNRGADFASPKTPISLRDLVLSLINATPLQNRTDTDGDGLPNLVENVIGTDFNCTDSDSDLLNDTYEALNNWDPLNPDSNNDGVSDYDEVTDVSSLDIDNDGVSNVWDFDNDNDGVNDNSDLSPFGVMSEQNAVDISVQNSGNPVFIEMQIVPQNLEHLRLFNQYWNWPDDDEGLMRDLDGSTSDVKVVPVLNITTNQLPDMSSLREQGITLAHNGMHIDLSPITEYGNPVAFNGRMYYQSAIPLTISFKVELIWKVIGYSDFAAKAFLAQNGMYLTTGANQAAVANASLVSEGTLKWIECGENKIALRHPNGYYLSIASDGKLYFNATSVGEDEIFETTIDTSNHVRLIASNEAVVSLGPSNTLITGSGSEAVFSIVDRGYYPESTLLCTYHEPFTLTGFTARECIESNLGLFYSGDEVETIATNMLLSYEYLRNTTTTLWDIPTLLATENITILNQTRAFSDKFNAFISMSNEMLPLALGELPVSQILPVIIGFDERSKVGDLADILPIIGNSFSMNISGLNVVTMKTLRTEYYNTSSRIALTDEEIVQRVLDSGFDEQGEYNFLIMTFRWIAGQSMITAVGSISTIFDESESSFQAVFDVLQQTKDIILTVNQIQGDLKDLWKAFKNLRSAATRIRDLAEGLETINMATDIAKTAAKTGTIGKFISKIGKGNILCEVLSAVIDLGFSIAAGCLLADAIGGVVGTELGITYAVASFAFSVLAPFLALMLDVFTGGLASLALFVINIIDLLFGTGWGDSIVGWLTSWIYGSPEDLMKMSASSRIEGTPKITTYDYDNNGLDAGDRIEFTFDVVGSVVANGENPLGYALLGYNIPYITLSAPTFSNSLSGFELPISDIPMNEWNATWRIYNATAIWKDIEYNQTVWLVPGIGMPNFPVTIDMHDQYLLYYVWEHDVLGIFPCEHVETIANQGAYQYSRVYFDVMPGSLDDFLKWRYISPIDRDGDELTYDEEVELHTNAWNSDTDGDFLSDKYESDNGFNPCSYDSDFDDVIDFYEARFGTNPQSQDSDQDGLSDFLEIAGWIINFNYMGNESLPFSMRVVSDPNMKNSDGDELDDYTEYYCNTNPRSNDTNGDAIDDVQTERLVSILNYDTSCDIVLNGWVWDAEYYEAALVTTLARVVDDIAVDAYGYVYATSFYDDYYDEIKKFDSNLTEVVLPDTSYFTQNDAWAIDGSVFGLEVDLANDWLYAWTYRWDWTLSLLRFNLDGSVLNPGSYTPFSFYIQAAFNEPDLIGSVPLVMSDIDLNSTGHIFATYYLDVPSEGNPSSYGPIDVLDQSGTLLDTWEAWLPTGSPFEPLPEEFDNPVAIAVDSENGYVYVAETAEPWMYNYTRVAKFRMSDGAYVSALPDVFLSIEDIDVDLDGYVYVLGNTTQGPCLKKFDQNGLEEQYFALYGNGTLNFTRPIAVAVDSDYNIFILDTIERGYPPSTSRIWKFGQTMYPVSSLTLDSNPDWDGDGLPNSVEVMGQDIYVEFSQTLNATFRVTSSPLLNDTDFDGLSDFTEFGLGSNPRSPDTDQDGTPDHEEWWMCTFPGVPYTPPSTMAFSGSSSTYGFALAEDPTGPDLTRWDSDGDLLGDTAELSFGSNPVAGDTDGDSLSDLLEFQLNSNPVSNDSDLDGVSDLYEYQHSSSLISPDSDGDFWFDGAEYDSGTDPLDIDYDGDGVLDGNEYFYGTSPLLADSDGDGAPDGLEIMLHLNPRSNDTDNDGVPDGVELDYGSNPWRGDSDFDGLSDNVDPDTFTVFEGPIILAYDSDEYNQTAEFAEKLSLYTQVIVVSLEELLESYTNYEYIVLVGQPASETGTVCGLMYELLEDTGTTLLEMMQEDAHKISLRYGVWTNPQTVMMFSQVYPIDAFAVLQILRGRNVTILPNNAIIELNSQPFTDNLTYQYSFVIDEIDVVKATDCILSVTLSSIGLPTVNIHKYTESETTHQLGLFSGLPWNEGALGVYLEIIITGEDSSSVDIQEASLRFYYKETDLDRNGNGVLNDWDDFIESTLALYCYDESAGTWVRLTEELDWVLEVGVNTTDVEVYGESYAGYVWARVTHLSLFAVAGQVGNWMTFYWLPLSTIGAISIGLLGLFIFKRKRTGTNRVHGKTKKAKKSSS